MPRIGGVPRSSLLRWYIRDYFNIFLPPSLGGGRNGKKIGRSSERKMRVHTPSPVLSGAFGRHELNNTISSALNREDAALSASVT